MPPTDRQPVAQRQLALGATRPARHALRLAASGQGQLAAAARRWPRVSTVGGDRQARPQLRRQRILGSSTIFTGTRCTILVKLPVAFSGGSSANCAPVPGARLSTVPLIGMAGKESMATATGWPGCICAGLRLLEVRDQIDALRRHDGQQPRAGAARYWPGRTVRSPTTPSIGAVMRGLRQVDLRLVERRGLGRDRRVGLLALRLQHVDMRLRGRKRGAGRWARSDVVCCWRCALPAPVRARSS